VTWSSSHGWCRRLPELGKVWFGAGRAGQVAALTEYLTRRATAGVLRLPGPTPGEAVAATLAGLLTHGLLLRKG
jgi:hypothetical protein